jgi:sec-independent protein translocase protein TatA
MLALLLFGAKRLPEIGRSMGKGLREFKDSVSTNKAEILGDSDDDDADEQPELPAATSHVETRAPERERDTVA